MTTEFFEKYKHKIVDKKYLLKLIGTFPRQKKAVICHGVFDVVHPGHVRHLVYAKTKADFLIASITPDRFIEKGIYRPHIPEKLRALNLAAFEMVDYVVITDDPKPLETILFLKPDLFAKGFEYSSEGVSKATQEEIDAVNAYGGNMIFTPGDVIYSSSKFINAAPPKTRLEKFLLLMESNNISFSTLRQNVNNLSGVKVLVVGDTIIDSYTRTRLIGGQTKTPTFSVAFEEKDDYVGGAGIVAQHLSACGANVEFLTILGDDDLGKFTILELEKKNVTIKPIFDKNRPTTNKNAIIADGYRLLKIDTVDNTPISNNIVENLANKIEDSDADIVVFSDFRHGVFNKSSIKKLTASIPENTFKVADSQVASRWGNITEFKNFDLITPNEREARFALGDQDSTVSGLANLLTNETLCKSLLLKLGSKGVFCSFGSGQNKLNFSLDSFTTKNVVDAVGAGDALLSYASIVLYKEKCLLTASILGSIAAACECEVDGNIPINPSDVIKKINEFEKLCGYE